MGTRNDVVKALIRSQFTSRTPHGVLVRIGDIPALAADVFAAATKTGDGAGASPAASADTRTPSVQADQDGRPPAPSSPRRFQLYRHTDVSGLSGTGVVAEGIEWTDKTATLRWHGEHPATAVWDSVQSIFAIHGHQGASEIRWLDQDPEDCTCLDPPGPDHLPGCPLHEGRD